MKVFSYLIAIFSLLILSGGLYGYFYTSSIPSLVMSSIFFLVLSISSFYIYQGSIRSLYLAAISIFALHFFFLMRFLKTYKLFPSGIMVLLTAGLAAPVFYYLTKKVKEKNYETP